MGGEVYSPETFPSQFGNQLIQNHNHDQCQVRCRPEYDVGDVQLNCLLEGHLQYLQYTHNTYEAIRRYRALQNAANKVTVNSPQYKTHQTYDPVEDYYVNYDNVQILGSEDERYHVPNNNGATNNNNIIDGYNKTHEVYDVYQVPQHYESYKAQQYQQLSQESRGITNNCRKQKVLDWVMKIDETLLYLDSEELCCEDSRDCDYFSDEEIELDFGNQITGNGNKIQGEGNQGRKFNVNSRYVLGVFRRSWSRRKQRISQWFRNKCSMALRQ
eukprot:TRINITY_DN1290_c0_g1_i4.p5 TRINITY_DN1290_c0_g1~~TRINITY_DN1290_c0_g1_i4.p5  ORF type:complete len:271 (-),score=12.52 TRINITY_DN1290_c0_g1_i4:3540-4352(-)